MGKSHRALFEEFEGWPVAMTSDADTGDGSTTPGFAAKIDVAGGGMVNGSSCRTEPPRAGESVAQGVARARNAPTRG
jgi:hypothetical protein